MVNFYASEFATLWTNYFHLRINHFEGILWIKYVYIQSQNESNLTLSLLGVWGQVSLRLIDTGIFVFLFPLTAI